MWEKGCYNRLRMQCKSSRFAYFLRRNCVNSFQELLQSIDWGSLTDALLRVLGVFLCLTVHETCHGLAAYALGDPTAKREHRLSLNPLHHIDWFGLAAMLLVGFGWAKPVPINTRYFKKPRGGMALSALAGPVSNLLMSLVAFIIGQYVFVLGGAQMFSADVNFMQLLFIFFQTFYILNLGLAIFNLVPVPPLDGSRILLVFLPDKIYFGIMRYERYIYLALLVCLYLGVLDAPLNAAMRGVLWLFSKIAGILPLL